MSVVERPDNLPVEPPSGSYNRIEPFRFLDSHNNALCVLILLNQSLAGMDLPLFWASTELHICADGGANRLYDLFGDARRDDYVPEFITGDFDSLRSEVRDFYKTKGTRIIEQATQYATDFMKAVTIAKLWYALPELKDVLARGHIDPHDGLAQLEKSENDKGPQQPDKECGLVDVSARANSTVYLYILSALGGRFDQTVHSISQLYQLNETDPQLRLLFATKYDVVFVLDAGTNYVAYKSKSLFSSSPVPTCGLLPLGSSSVKISSRGLKYDVEDWPSSMTTQVSSSNGLSGTTGVVVSTLGPLVMNIEWDNKDRGNGDQRAVSN